MSELQLATARTLARDMRAANRAVSRFSAQAVMRVSGFDSEIDVGLAKIEALTHATGAAMTAVSRVSAAQRNLEMLAPDASGRLAYLADDHLMSVASVLEGLRNSARRS